jgi:protein SCO1/2
MKRRSMLLAAAATGGAVLLSACDGPGSAPKANFKATDVTGADYGKTLALTDHTGRARTLADFSGKVVVLFFGFTQCPDVCPTTLSTMSDVMKRLGPDSDRVQVIFVTVDPERDTPTVLGPYVTAFDPRFLALYGDKDAINKATREFKVFFQKVPGKTEGTYSIDHTAASYVLDPKGRLRLYVRHQQTGEEIAADLKLLLSGA